MKQDDLNSTVGTPNLLQSAELDCPICGTESEYLFTSKHQQPVYECENLECWHFFTPASDSNQGVCARDEDLEKESDDSLRLFHDRNRSLLKLFKGHLESRPRPYRFLDFGAGNAHISRTFKNQLGDDVQIYCLEANPRCARLYEKFRLVHTSSLENLPVKMDLVYMIEVIEHLADPLGSLTALKNKLQPDGILFLSTPLGKANEGETHAYDTPSHLHFFTEKSLKLALKQAGFSEINFRYFPELHQGPSKNGMSRSIRFIKKLIKKITGRDRTAAPVPHLAGFTGPRGLEALGAFQFSCSHY